MLLVALLGIGLCAGALTTLCGVGGALVAVAATSLLMSAKEALVVSAAALLVGSVHRTWVYRRAVDRPIATRMGAGLVGGALLGAAVATKLPEPLLRGALVAVSAAALASAANATRVARGQHAANATRAARGPRVASWRSSPRWLALAGLGIGVMGATAGGAALLIAPLLQAVGLRGDRYAATGAAAATIFNASRFAGYGAVGMVRWSDETQLGTIAALSLACVAGNVAGVALRSRCSPRLLHLVELAAPPLAIAMLLLGG